MRLCTCALLSYECLYKYTGARGLIFGLSPPLLLYFVNESSEGSGETVHMHSLV